ncbi:MAG: repressor LexA [Bacteroidetes bacterium]|nr:MAG: repressor LexA [Bacteroidota bacterium]
MNRTERKDLEGYAFIRNEIMHTGVTPSLRNIGRVVGYKSPRSVQLMLERLQRMGLLRYESGKIRLNQRNTPSMSEQTVEVPLVGSVTCGSPALAEQDVQAVIQVSVKLAKPGHRYFLLRASGNSMNKSGISDGDLVLVRQQATANEGDKVVALIDDEATIKHFHRERGIVVLKPNSTGNQFMPIVLSNEFLIQGVVVNTIPDPF